LVSVAIAAAVVAPAPPAMAGPPAVDAQAKAKAAKAFRAAEAAFKRGEFRAAAEGFDAAHAAAPHPFALWNAALAWDKAGERLRAAERCEAFLERADPGDKNRPDAERLLSTLVAALARLELSAPDGTELSVDGAPAAPGRRLVHPGDHVVGARFGGEVVTRTVHVAAGVTERVVLTAPAAAAPASAPPPASSATPAAAPRPDKPLHPAWFFVGLGATAALGAVTIWSGVDTNAAADEFHAHPTQAGLDDGRGRQTRTNALVVATGVSAIATAALGVFAVRWSSSPRVGVALSTHGACASLGARF
jgi:hypothetical protein